MSTSFGAATNVPDNDLLKRRHVINYAANNSYYNSGYGIGHPSTSFSSSTTTLPPDFAKGTYRVSMEHYDNGQFNCNLSINFSRQDTFGIMCRVTFGKAGTLALAADTEASLSNCEIRFPGKIDLKLRPAHMDVEFSKMGTALLWQQPSTTATPQIISTFNKSELCDASILPASSTVPLYVSRAVLSSASSFFNRMFTGDWAESTCNKRAIPMSSWRPAALVLAIAHLYSGWLPGDDLHQEITSALDDYNLEYSKLSTHDWLNTFELAGMLELPTFAAKVRYQMMAEMDRQLAVMGKGQSTR
ncbi:hypothetical protein H9P43_000125 [Blastocladiella emersonii ATCC 22665]|nr:hypothetical protein H9P43_000125 [Blastocladiella emersonii ATCC 22665]